MYLTTTKINCAILALCPVLFLASPVAIADRTKSNTDLTNTVQLMRKQIHQLEGQVSSLTPAEQNNGWFNKVEMSGAIEIEASFSDPEGSSAESGISLATVELAIDASAHNNQVNVHMLVLHEDDDPDTWEIDEGIISIGNTDNTLYFSGGRMYVPFGNFTSNAVSDPLTLEIAETREAAIQLGFEVAGYYGSVFAFNGDTNTGDESIEHFGGNLGLIQDTSWGGFDIGLSYVNNIADSDAIQGYLDATGNTSITDNVSAWAGYATFNIGDFMLIGEYVSAIDDFSDSEIQFNAKGAALASANLEVAYNFAMFGTDSTFALAYQQTEQALFLGLPEERMLAALSAAIYDDTTLSFEWARDNDYASSDLSLDDAGDVLSGSGKSADTVTLQLAVDF